LARFAGLPVTLVTLVEMKTAQRKAALVVNNGCIFLDNND
jgi:hypothetical protein